MAPRANARLLPPARGLAGRLAALLGFSLLAGPALAIDYLSVAEATALYDAPSLKATAVYAIAAGTPVEQVVTVEGWVKVRDQKGDLAWIEKRLLADKRTVIVRADRAQVRAQADDKAPLAFEALQDVVLELLEPASVNAGGWAKVRHRDGQQGFVKVLQVWGL